MNAKVTVALVVVFILSVAISMAGVTLLPRQGEMSPQAAGADVTDQIEALKLEVAELKHEIIILKQKPTPIYAASRTANPAMATPASGSKNAPDATLDPGKVVVDKDRLDRLVDERLEERKRLEEADREKRREERAVENQERTVKRLTDTYADRLKKFTEALDLTEGQQEEVRAAFEDRKEQMLKFYGQRRNRNEIPENERMSWEDINKQFQATMETVLTEEQLKTYKEKNLDDLNSGQRRSPRRTRRPGR